MGIGSILLIAAFILTLIAAWWRGGPWPGGFPAPHPGWLGVSLWFLSLILGGR